MPRTLHTLLVAAQEGDPQRVNFEFNMNTNKHTYRKTNTITGRRRVAEVAREYGWHPPKSLDSDENFKPEHTLFCRELRFVAIYALFFGDLWA